MTAMVALIQTMPLTVVALLGRMLGQVAWWLDWRHRRIALVNLDIAFGREKSRAERHEIAREQRASRLHGVGAGADDPVDRLGAPVDMVELQRARAGPMLEPKRRAHI